MKSANQAVFDEVFKISQELGYNTYYYLPEDVPYPFVYIGEQISTPMNVKSDKAQLGNSNVTIHFYGELKNRNLISSMIQNLELKLKKIREADAYSVRFFDAKNQLIQDKSSAITLWHGILDSEFTYTN